MTTHDKDFGKMQQDQEDANFFACREAFLVAHPNKPSYLYESCEDGEWLCNRCPWKKEE